MTLSDLAKQLSVSSAPDNAGICKGCVIYKKLVNAVDLNKKASDAIEKLIEERKNDEG